MELTLPTSINVHLTVNVAKHVRGRMTPAARSSSQSIQEAIRVVC